MEFRVGSFIENPTWEVLNSCKKADLIQIAHHYGITVTSGSKKDVLKQAIVTVLLEKRILRILRLDWKVRVTRNLIRK